MSYLRHHFNRSVLFVPIDAKRNVTTGISAADRAATMLAAIDPKTTAGDLARPGHMSPLRSRDGGVLVARGRPRRRWTWRGSPDSSRPASSAKS